MLRVIESPHPQTSRCNELDALTRSASVHFTDDRRNLLILAPIEKLPHKLSFFVQRNAIYQITDGDPKIHL